MSFITYGLKMQAAAFQLQLAYDANDTISMQDALRRMEAAERMHKRRQDVFNNHFARSCTFRA
jgi:hypothetical protein